MRVAYCKNGVVVATHDDSQNISASVYGEGVIAVPIASAVAGNPMPDLTASDLLAFAAFKRRAVVNGGCVVAVDGLQIPIWADDKTIATLTALMMRASADPNLVIPSWKARDGTFFELNAGDIATLANGLFAFIQTAFDVEGAVAADIAAENITTLEEIEAADWPSND